MAICDRDCFHCRFQDCIVDTKGKYSREYYQQHREKIREYQKKYKEAHREALKEYHRKYREEHREELREYRHRRYLDSKRIKEKEEAR